MVSGRPGAHLPVSCPGSLPGPGRRLGFGV